MAAQTFDPTVLPSQLHGPFPEYAKQVGMNYVDIPAGSSQSAIQALLSANPPYTKFWLLGMNRLTTGSLVLKQGQEIHGAYGAGFNGSKLIGSDASELAQLGTAAQAEAGTHWTFDSVSNRYYIGAQTQARVVFPTDAGYTDQGFERATTNQELFLDGKRVQHSPTLSALASGQWFFDDAADRIYVKDNPSGKKIETSIATYCINSEVDGIKLYNIVVEKFANYAGYGAVRLGGDDSLAQYCDFSYNHGAGIVLSGNRGQVLDFKANWNGEQGIGATSAGIDEVNNYQARGHDNLFLRGEVGYNNDAHFKTGWQGGGSKFWAQTNLRVAEVWCHDNRGVGLWTDTNNYKTVFESNLVEDTGSYAMPGGTSLTTEGITIEICYDTVVRNNIIRHVGKPGGWANGAGIAVMGSYNVEVSGNTIEDCGRGIMGGQQLRTDGYTLTWNLEFARFGNSSIYGQDVEKRWRLKGLYVHDNIMRAPVNVGQNADENFYAGVVADDGDDAVFTSSNNRFDGNKYYIAPAIPYPFVCANGMRTWAAFQSYGYERTGTMVVGAPGVPTIQPTPVPTLTGASNNLPPVGNIGGPYSGRAAQPIQFDGSKSYDSDGSITEYLWNFGDGVQGNSAMPSHVYSFAGTFTVALTVKDNNGATSNLSTVVVVSAPLITPSAPTNLQATLSSSKRSVNLLWSNGPNNGGAVSVDRWCGQNQPTSIATLSVRSVAFTDRNAASKTTYNYRVCATNSAGFSCSNVATMTVPK